MNSFERLQGRHLCGIKINPEKTCLVFCLDDGGTEAFSATGQCCSSSWFEHIEGASCLRKGRPLSLDSGMALITLTEDIEMPLVKCDRDNLDVVKAYGFKITTDKGLIQIEMRNESSGYYGGDVVRGFMDQRSEYREDDIVLKDVSEDF